MAYELIIVFLPFLAFLFVFSHLQLLRAKIASLICLISVGLSAILSWIHIYKFLQCKSYIDAVHEYSVGTWFSVGLLKVDAIFLFDALTLTMLVIITTISFLVHLYSFDYMLEDPEFPLFMSYLSLFTFFMVFFVSSGNFVLMFLGWEGVGLSSYLLINFWHTRLNANKAAVKAIIVNKIGDVSLMFAMCCLFFSFRSLDYITIFTLVPHLQPTNPFYFSSLTLLDISALFILFAAVAKSAQLGLHTWLPDAMEGPTPVSALIHAATMVTAGIFLIVRCSPLIEFSSFTLNVATLLRRFNSLFCSINSSFPK